MFFLNLTAAEFLTLLGGLGALIAALYLLDRTKRKKIVSTLRFWTPAANARENQRRKRVRDPWSLVLQLVSLLLLLLAIAQLQWGSRERHARNYVVLLDASAWSAQRTGEGTVLDREKQAVQRYLAALTPRDRVMLVRADALAAPLTPFTSDRAQIANALRRITPGFSALNLEQALTFAQQAQRWSGGEAGEVVYVGPRMIPENDAVSKPANLRVIAVEREHEHLGIRAIGVQQSEADENAWQAAVTLKNYGTHRATAHLDAQFAGTTFAPRAISLDGGAESSVEYNFITNTAGQLVAEVRPGDVSMGDNRIALPLPRIGTLRVAVFTDRPEVYRPLFSASNRLSVRYFPASGRDADVPADLMVLDRTARTVPANVPSIWVDPPRERSPLPVKAIVRGAAIRIWHSETPLGESLHARDTHIPSSEVFHMFEGDIAIGSVAEGPVVVARGPSRTNGKIAVIGFDPLDGESRLELTTPLLFANLLRWISPDVFRPVDVTAERVGAITVPLNTGEPIGRIRVFNQNGAPLPFVAAEQNLQLFTSAPEVLRVISDGRERVLSVTVPDVAAFEWKPPAHTAAGIPARSRFAPGALDLWRWLTVLAASCLFVEWILFGRQRVFKRRTTVAESAHSPADRREREIAAR